ncbi:(2,3-dihydroxybenzoyl)adenylate synthase [Nocardioides daejeonensis]|uniref:(2,3-dihydroxybenzoyl)adenylate synthase n=1 Tax=Nocardioides daejeonensis TaxID=1046556 RepID=UPI000D745D25|nr:AMP-binding protein [Nocardioides daejeonensis]
MSERPRSPLASVRSWPDEFRLRYRAAGLWHEETFADFLADRTDRFASRTAVVGVDAHGDEQRWTYRELAARAAHAARVLRDAGVREGDRVVLTLPNVVEFVAFVAGCFRMGALPVFAQPGHREAELTQFCLLSDAAALVLCGDTAGYDHRGLAERVTGELRRRGGTPPAVVDVQDPVTDGPALAGRPAATTAPVTVRPGASAEEVAFLQLSGGTTGISKLIPRTHADYLYSVRASAEICELDEQSVMLVVLPAAHNFAMSSPGILGVLHAGGTVVLAPDPSPRTAFRLIEQERVTLTALVPPLAQAWLSSVRRRRPDLSSLRVLQVGGAKLADTVAAQLGPALGVRVQQVFGMAEGLVNYTRADDPESVTLTSQGRPISDHDEIRIVHPTDPAEPEVGDGEEGALLTRGPYTIRGYYRDEIADRDSFTADGFYRTGDLVRRLPSGHLVVTGRAKDQINRAGEKVACEELEQPLLAHPEVLDVVALGLPDPYLGERICVVVRPEPEAASIDTLPERLVAHLRDSGLATWKLPDDVRLLDVFPTTHVGKNSRRELRQLLASHLQEI